VTDARAREILTIPGQAGQVRAARRFVTGTLGPEHPCAEIAVLLVSELVANSVQHSRSALDGGKITIAVASGSGEAAGVRVEVTDDGAATLPMVCKARIEVENGRGMFLVDCLATAWGYQRCGHATTTWFELAAERETAGVGPVAGPPPGDRELRGRISGLSC
jgi:anti-sigma regulatory factor (Ser/Thr protein kinase)